MMAKKALATNTNTNTNSAKNSNGDLNHNNVPNTITVPSADPLLSCILAASSSPCSQTSSPDAFYHFHQQLLQQNQQPPVFEELPPRTFPDCPAWKGIHAAIASGGTLGIPAHYRKDCREQPELALPVTYYRPMVYSNSTDPPGLVPFFFSPREEDEEEYGEDEWGVRPSGRPPLYQSSPPAERILKGAPIALVPMYTKPVPKPRAGWRAVADLEAAKPEPPPPAIYHHTLRSLQTAHPEEELDDPQGSFLYHFEEIGSGVRALSFHLPMRRRWTEPVELVMSEALASETPSRRVNAPLFPAPFSLPTGLVRAITVRQIYGGGGVGLSGPAKKQNPLAAARESPLYAVELICDPAEVWLQPALVVGNHVEVLVRLRDATLMGKEAAALPGDHGPLLAEATFELHRSEGAARVVVALYLTTAVYVASAVTAIADGTGGSGRDLTVTGAFPNTIEVEAEVYLRNGFTLRPRRVEIPLVTICPMAVHLRGEPLAVTTAAAAAKGGKGGKRGAKLAASLPCLACKRIATPIYVEPPAVMRTVSATTAILRLQSPEVLSALQKVQPLEYDPKNVTIDFDSTLAPESYTLELNNLKLESSENLSIQDLAYIGSSVEGAPSDMLDICNTVSSSTPTLSDILKSGAVDFLLFFTSDLKQLKDYVNISGVKILHSSDESLAKSLGCEFPGVFLYNSMDKITLAAKLPKSVEHLEALRTLGVFSRINGSNYQKFGAIDHQVFYIIDDGNAYSGMKERLSPIMKNYASKAKFVFFTPSEIQGFVDNLNLTEADYPVMVNITETSKLIIKNLKYDGFSSAVDSMLDGTAPQFRFIEKLPEDNESRNLKVLNSDTMLETIKDLSVDRFIFFSSPRCQHCESFTPVLTEIANLMKEKNVEIFFGKYNVIENEKIPEYTINAVPALYYAKKGSEKMEEIKLGTRDVKDIISYIHKEGVSAKFELEDLIGKAEEAKQEAPPSIEETLPPAEASKPSKEEL